ncbi:MAG: hypothetical protein WCJ64_03640 [Rhodospirillaceae bacterium]
MPNLSAGTFSGPVVVLIEAPLEAARTYTERQSPRPSPCSNGVIVHGQSFIQPLAGDGSELDRVKLGQHVQRNDEVEDTLALVVKYLPQFIG